MFANIDCPDEQSLISRGGQLSFPLHPLLHLGLMENLFQEPEPPLVEYRTSGVSRCKVISIDISRGGLSVCLGGEIFSLGLPACETLHALSRLRGGPLDPLSC